MPQLLVIMRLFPLGEGFILRVKEALFLRGEACTVDVPNRTVIPASNSTRMTMSRLAVYTTVGGKEAYIQS